MAKKTTGDSSTQAADATEQRLVKFAEQLGRMAGTLQAKADGWIDRETLNKQIASVRDGAAELIKHLGVGAKKAAKKKPATAAARPRDGAAARLTRPARSTASRVQPIRMRGWRRARRRRCVRQSR